MGTGAGKRDERKQRTRSEILDRALALYRERGVDGTRVQDIIERVGISEKTFFNYFPSKQAILEAAGDERLAVYVALLDHELDAVNRPVVDRLAEIVALWAQTFSADRDFLATVATRTSFFFGSIGATRERQRHGQLRLAELLRQGQRRDEIRADLDPVQLAELLTATLTLTTINWLDRWWDGPDERLGPRLEHALDVFLTGARAEHRSRPRRTPPSRAVSGVPRGRRRPR